MHPSDLPDLGEFLYQHDRARLFRTRTPGGDGIIHKQRLGPDALARTRNETRIALANHLQSATGERLHAAALQSDWMSARLTGNPARHRRGFESEVCCIVTPLKAPRSSIERGVILEMFATMTVPVFISHGARSGCGRPGNDCG
jgi:hypothetical protein